LVTKARVVVDLKGANLTEVNLGFADVVSAANLHRTDLREIALRGVNLTGANLRETDLSAANLREAKLRSTDLSGIDLSAANLLRADLGGANLQGANLSLADLREADLTSATMPNGQKYEDWLKDKEGRGEDGEDGSPS
jgi:uncharacterized protein YjbI with pentapeptide repeats